MCKSNSSPKCILFLSFDRCYMVLTCYPNRIYIFCMIYRLWRWHSWSFFYFSRSRIQLWQKKLQIWQKKRRKKSNSKEFMEFFFSMSDSVRLRIYIFVWQPLLDPSTGMSDTGGSIPLTQCQYCTVSSYPTESGRICDRPVREIHRI